MVDEVQQPRVTVGIPAVTDRRAERHEIELGTPTFDATAIEQPADSLPHSNVDASEQWPAVVGSSGVKEPGAGHFIGRQEIGHSAQKRSPRDCAPKAADDGPDRS